jgi:ABC-2 type transport system ATP-binding protein
LRAARDEKPIDAEGLVRRFGDLVAVAGIDLVVEQGEIFGLLGPNGAGKSTTTRMLTMLLKPTAGRARVADYDVEAEAGQVRRSIGVALQDAAIGCSPDGTKSAHVLSHRVRTAG